MSNDIIVGGVYRYITGDQYKVLHDEVKDTETGEWLVIYQAMFGDHLIFAQSRNRFLLPASDVDHDRYPDAQQEKRFQLVGQEVAPIEPEAPSREGILETARMLVCGDRDISYGRPESSFATIGKLWAAFRHDDKGFSAADVACMLMLLKVARISSNPGHLDSWIDACGYAACGGEIAAQKAADQGEGQQG